MVLFQEQFEFEKTTWNFIDAPLFGGCVQRSIADTRFGSD